MHELLSRALGDDLLGEVVGLTRDLVRVDTTNPPGNETLAVDVLEAYLAGNGIESERVARDPARANLIARVRGRGTGPVLALAGHTDVVYADAADWSSPATGTCGGAGRSI
jgi:acetylornithine deacetylase/succinyl-diaminopimelate desuccinylase-like protein